MRTTCRKVLHCMAFGLFALFANTGYGQNANVADAKFALDSVAKLESIDAEAEVVTYRGRRAVHLQPARRDNREWMMAIATGPDFRDGTIEVDLAGSPRAGAPPDSRDFIGIAFRLQQQGSRFECLYIRPTNGRATDQLRRNHSTQYISHPDFPWERLREEAPGVYESYVDLDTGAWTRMKIVVSGLTARLSINGTDQPCLIVKDLKLGESHGQIALWADQTTDAYFSNLVVTGAAKP